MAVIDTAHSLPTHHPSLSAAHLKLQASTMADPHPPASSTAGPPPDAETDTDAASAPPAELGPAPNSPAGPPGPPPTYTATQPQILVVPLPDASSFFWGRTLQGEVYVKGIGEARVRSVSKL